MITSTDSTASRTHGEAQLVVLVRAARQGDRAAWEQLVRQFEPMLRKVAGSHRLAPADVEDVVQATWTLLLTHIDRIREPAAIAGWLATTARRQSLALLHGRRREHLTDDPDVGLACDETPESAVLSIERDDALTRAVAMLPDRQRRVVTMLFVRPALDYRQLSSILQMPAGSIGPTRARGLARLRRDARLSSLCAAA